MASSFHHRHVRIKDHDLHLVECGPAGASAIVFLHGWPQDWSAFKQVMQLASKTHRAIALDLPGIGQSTTSIANGDKHAIAQVIHDALQTLQLHRITLVGHDVGGQIAYAYLRQYTQELEQVVIMDVVIPGLEPWEEVLRNPHIWHFAFHNVPHLPEELVAGKQADYFDFFFNAITAQPKAITAAARHRYAQAYMRPAALSMGFEWYRAFEQDARTNSANHASVATPVLYLRGDHESGDIAQYVHGLRGAGLTNVSQTLIPQCGHFAAEEQPEKTWASIAEFLRTIN